MQRKQCTLYKQIHTIQTNLSSAIVHKSIYRTTEILPQPQHGTKKRKRSEKKKSNLLETTLIQ